MTREEAIEYWEGLRKTFSSQLEKEENHFGRMHLQTTIDALDMAISALRQQDHFREVTKKVEPLTLDDLVELGIREENGENIIVYCTPLNDWAKVFKFGLLFFGTEDYRSWPEIEEDYGKTWLAYRQKPAEEDYD